MKTKVILLIACLALLLHDANCGNPFKGCCGGDDDKNASERDPLLANQPTTVSNVTTTATSARLPQSIRRASQASNRTPTAGTSKPTQPTSSAAAPSIHAPSIASHVSATSVTSKSRPLSIASGHGPSGASVHAPSIRSNVPADQASIRSTATGSSRRSLTDPEIVALNKEINTYKINKEIYKGEFAYVYSATHLLTGKEVAIKVIDKAETGKDDKDLLIEPNNMEGLNHPGIMKLFQFINKDKYLFIVMEFASGGDIYDYANLGEHGKIEEEEARDKFKQLVSAVEYLHRNKIVHRELMPDNLLLDGNKKIIKIADFGYSKQFTPNSKLDPFPLFAYNTAPEVYAQEKYDGPKADVWALGVFLFEILSGHLPFDYNPYETISESVAKGYSDPDVQLSNDCKNLLRRILEVDPKKRLSVNEMMKHPWIKIDPYVEPLDLNQQNKQIKELLVKNYYEEDAVNDAISKADYTSDVFASFLISGGTFSKAHSGGSTSHKPGAHQVHP